MNEYDVIVVGGGCAGPAAAISAARAGAKTLLIEKNPFAGGTWTAGSMSLIFDGTYQPGVMKEMLDALRERDALAPFHVFNAVLFAPETMKVLLDEMMLDAGVRVRFGTMVQEARVESSRIVSIDTASKSGRETWRAPVFVDATGDGDLGAYAGCGYDVGRSSDGKMQPGSMNAILGGWPEGLGDGEKLGDDIIATLDRQGFELSYRKTRLFEVPGQPEIRRCMWTHLYGLDPRDADSISAAGVEGRRQIHGAVKALRESGDERFARLYVVSTGPFITFREGRRIHGLHTLTIDDLRAGRQFDDGVAQVRFNVDVHSVDPAEGKHLACENVPPYLIPYRSMVARDVGNMLMAGRCISGDFTSHASYRASGDCVVVGEVAGRAAAAAAAQGCSVADVDPAAVAMLPG